MKCLQFIFPRAHIRPFTYCLFHYARSPSAQRMINPLDYNIGVPAEDLGNYCPGGYHPILLNDKLHDGRYEIVHKLGFGSFSTVWLARDHR